MINLNAWKRGDIGARWYRGWLKQAWKICTNFLKKYIYHHGYKYFWSTIMKLNLEITSIDRNEKGKDNGEKKIKIKLHVYVLWYILAIKKIKWLLQFEINPVIKKGSNNFTNNFLPPCINNLYRKVITCQSGLFFSSSFKNMIYEKHNVILPVIF